MKSPVTVNLTLLFIAIVWGFGFVPQKLGMEYVGPAAFNTLRFTFGALTLIPIMFLFSFVSWRQFADAGTVEMGAVLGVLLFGGALLQQISLQYTSVANVSFITGLYVIVVPLIGYFIGYRYGFTVWLGGIVAVMGLYLMTSGGDAGAVKGDLIAMVGAVIWALHLLVIAEKAANYNQIALSFYQFSFCAVLSLVYALGFEPQVLPDSAEGYLWPLVNGVIVVGVAYTLQVMIMDHAEPFSASLILSLEAVFGALAGLLVFQEQLTMAAIVGAVMMLLGCLMAQSKGRRSPLEGGLAS